MKRALISLATLCAAFAAQAQEKAPLAEETRALHVLVGTWDVVEKHEPGPGGEGQGEMVARVDGAAEKKSMMLTCTRR